MEEKILVVPPEARGLRIDLFLAKQLAILFSRNQVKALITSGAARLNGKKTKPDVRLSEGDEIVVRYEISSGPHVRAENIPIEVVYEDEDVIVVNKPAGMVVHPACGNPNGTLVNALLHHSKSLSKGGDPARPGIVHRLDKDTSGLMVVCKNDRAHTILSRQFMKHQIERVYWVVVSGVVQHEEMRAKDSLGRSETNRKKVVVKQEGGKPAVTNFRVLKRFSNATLLEAKPETGRTHQIRVHLQALGYPVLGDLMYGVHSDGIDRQALHAKELGFTHPTKLKKTHFDSMLPPDMKLLLKRLELKSV